MNDMPMTHRSSRSPILGISVAVLGVFVFLLGWRISSFIELQNRNLGGIIQSTRQQIEQGRPVDQSFNAFLNGLVQYLKATGDKNVAALMNRYGIPVRFAEAPPAGAPAGTQAPAPAAAQPAQPKR